MCYPTSVVTSCVILQHSVTCFCTEDWCNADAQLRLPLEGWSNAQLMEMGVPQSMLGAHASMVGAPASKLGTDEKRRLSSSSSSSTSSGVYPMLGKAGWWYNQKSSKELREKGELRLKRSYKGVFKQLANLLVLFNSFLSIKAREKRQFGKSTSTRLISLANISNANGQCESFL